MLEAQETERNIAAYLPNGVSESEGFHSYNYLLLTEPKDAATRGAAKWAIDAVKSRINATEKSAGARGGTNVFYFLVRDLPPENPETAWLVEHYDYGLSSNLLDRARARHGVEGILSTSDEPLVVSRLAGGILSHVNPASVKITELAMPAPRQPKPPPDDERGAHPFVGRDFLQPGFPEPPGYGLYSYVLLGDKTNNDNRQLYEAIVSAFLGLVEASRFSNTDKRQQNITYMPVGEPAPKDITAAWILDHYDHAAAQVLIAKLPVHANLSGVYIISYDQPVSAVGSLNKQRLLVQDLTGLPSDLAFLWFDKFVEQAREERYWDNQTIGQFMLDMRTDIAKIARAFGWERTANSDTNVLIAARIRVGQ
jgi:hypothetical protein